MTFSPFWLIKKLKISLLPKKLENLPEILEKFKFSKHFRLSNLWSQSRIQIRIQIRIRLFIFGFSGSGFDQNWTGSTTLTLYPSKSSRTAAGFTIDKEVPKVMKTGSQGRPYPVAISVKYDLKPRTTPADWSMVNSATGSSNQLTIHSWIPCYGSWFGSLLFIRIQKISMF